MNKKQDMNLKVYILLSFTVVLTTMNTYGQSDPKVIVPNFNDTYCKYVLKLETGQTDIDYQDFRYSFIKSEQFRIASSQSLKLDSLENEMYTQIDNSNYQEVVKITKQMLSIDYTNMTAHKILRQTYSIINDTINATKYKAIQFGLLQSIVENGDGQTCSTAWPVIQISEEYFILEMLDAELIQQSVDADGGICDKMEVLIDDEKRTYYFEITKVFEGKENLKN